MGTTSDAISSANASAARGLIADDQPLHVCVYGLSETNFIGGDFATEQADHWLQCMRICAEHPRCESVTWTDHAFGTCWLKRGDMFAQKQAGAMSFYVGKSSDCDIVSVVWPNTDFVSPSGDIGNDPGKNIQDCYKQCLEYAGCRGYTWSDFNGGTCWIKSGWDQMVPASGKNSAMAFRGIPMTV